MTDGPTKTDGTNRFMTVFSQQPSTQSNSTPMESNSRPSSPPPPQANTAVIHAVEDDDDVEVEDFLAGYN